MSDTLPFLLEIGTEEIPDWMIQDALEDLRKRFESTLEETGLGGKVAAYDATPRRLFLKAEGLLARQADREEVVTGPPKNAAYKDGQPTGAALGFAKKNNADASELFLATTEKGEYVALRKQVLGRAAAEILAERLPDLILGIPWPKSMYWTGKGGPRFIRPVRWIVALLGDAVVPFTVAEVASGNETRTHRQLGSRLPVAVPTAEYELELQRGGVLVSADSRRQRIEKGIHDLLNPINMRITPDAALLDTLVYLTEYPTPILGYFEESFLSLPREVLVEVMKKHQRYFSVVNKDGRLMPMFIAITNTDGDPEGFIRRGHERVLKARFKDARFFYDFDQQRLLHERLEDLKNVTFQAKLGSYFEKTQANVATVEELLNAVDFPQFVSGLIEGTFESFVSDMKRAALLAKCDLTTEMVKEFTDLQGIIGGIYARVQGEPEVAATAVYEHYKPLSMDDSIPASIAGQVLAVADKLHTLRACFAIGLVPTGSKDPFALRRAAQGLVKILESARLPLTLEQLAAGSETLREFLLDRIRYYFREVKGFAYDEVNAAFAAGITTLADLADRLDALKAVRPTADFEPLAAGLKRVRNILKQAAFTPAGPVNEALLEDGAERDLYAAFGKVQDKIRQYRQDRNYISALAAIASLRPAVDQFFDKVLVNAPDAAVRANRLTLLNTILDESSTIADFSEIVTS